MKNARNSSLSFKQITCQCGLLFLFIVVFSGCYKKAALPERQPPAVTVAAVEQRDVRLYKDYSGTTEASESVTVPARVQGFLETMSFTPGQMVKKNDPLFTIERTKYEADLKQAQSLLETQTAARDYAKSNFERGKELFAKEAIPEESFEERQRDYKQTEAAVLSAEASVIQAQLNLSYTEILAPVDGRISRNLIDVGNLVGELGTTAVQPLATINNMNPMYVYFQISDADFMRFVELYGQPKAHSKNMMPVTTPENNTASVSEPPALATSPAPMQTVPAQTTTPHDEEVPPWPFIAKLGQQENGGQTEQNANGYPYKGIINYTDNTIDAATGTITVRGEIPNPDYKIYPGTICYVKVPTRTFPNALVVYEKAIGIDLDNRYMFVLDKDKKIERRPVQVGDSVGDNMCIIENGLQPGETYIVDGLQKVRIGEPVNSKPYIAPKKSESEPPKPEPAA